MAVSPPPVDLDHLARQTGGDRALEREVLSLFLERSAGDLERLKQAAGQARREAAHRLVGSARAIGAGEVARLAAAVEHGVPDGDAADVSALEAALAETRRFVSQHLLR